MMYLKLSIRNAKRSFINYLLYVVTMTVLLAIIEVSNCIILLIYPAFQTNFELLDECFLWKPL